MIRAARDLALNLRKQTTWVAALAIVMAIAACGSPQPGSGVRAGSEGIHDYYTVRSDDDGNVIQRDISPEPRPREAITGDDYFQIKLEHIFVGDALGREVGNVAIISQIEGIIPDGVSCSEVDVSDLGFSLNDRERASIASSGCAYKHVVTVNPVFNDSHVTFDSAFITPPFRMGLRPIGLRFIIAQLNDYELAQQLLNWGEERVGTLNELGLGELNRWQSEMIDIGFTVANYVLDYASMPTYVFEFETDFVPIEIVGGVTTPQNLFMGGDFVIVGFPRDGNAPAGALVAADQLTYSSGRLYWRGSNVEFREGPYIVFKVVRQSRLQIEIPVNLAQMSRNLERGRSADDVLDMMRNAVLDLQDDRVLNETEGRYLIDLFDWFVGAHGIHAQLEDAAFNSTRLEPEEWPMQMRELPMTIGPDLSLVQLLSQAATTLERLDNRIYENYERNPGIWQAECIALRSMTQELADAYRELRPLAQTAFEDLQLARLSLQRSDRRSSREEDELEALEAAEVWASRIMEDAPESLPEPQCPGLRR